MRLNPAGWLDIRMAHNCFQTEYTELFAPKAYFNGNRTMHHADAGGRHSKNQLHSSQVDIVLNAEFGGAKWLWLIGGEHIRDYYQNRPWTYDYTVLEPVLDRDGNTLVGSRVYQFWDPFIHEPIRLSKVAVGPDPFTIYEEDPNRREGLYTSVRASFLNERLHAMAGIRSETFTQKIYSSGNLVDSLSVSAKTPMGGLLYEVTESLAFFASFSENYQPNRGVNVRGRGARDDEIEGLPPEYGRGYDVGLKLNFRDSSLSGSLTYFQLERENIARPDRLRNLTDPRNLDDSFTNNVTWTSVSGRERTAGIELDLLWQPSTQYQVLAAASWMWEARRVTDPALDPEGVEFERTIDNKLRLPNAPEYLLSIWNKYTFTEGRFVGLSAGIGFRYTSNVNPRGDEPLVSDLVLGGFVVWDAMVEYPFVWAGIDSRVQLTVRNLFDKKYSEGSEAYADPVRVYLSLRLGF